MARNKNILKKIELVQHAVGALYEPGNQTKSKFQAYRKSICKQYPMSERTFWRYMGTDVRKELEKASELETDIEG